MISDGLKSSHIQEIFHYVQDDVHSVCANKKQTYPQPGELLPFFNTQNKNYFTAANLVAAIALYNAPEEVPLHDALGGVTLAL